jgi:hypothetical protein
LYVNVPPFPYKLLPKKKEQLIEVNPADAVKDGDVDFNETLKLDLSRWTI